MSVQMSRKAEHVVAAQHPDAEHRLGPGWSDIDLIHEALPELDAEEVDPAVDLLGHRLRLPLVIAGMTGGHHDATELNARLARAAERYGIAIGVGSQRTALTDPATEPTYSVVREQAPTAMVLANVGASQLVAQHGRAALSSDDLQRLVDMIRADALVVHLNFLEEAIQPEGDSSARGCAEAISKAAALLDVPVIVKETGAGMSRSTAQRLKEAGAAAVDVGGAGGTSFAAIERMRADRVGDQARADLGAALADWGIPTAAAVASTARAGLPVIATGGVRSGLDAAKAIALGASAVGVARPLLLAALEGDQVLHDWIDRFALEVRTVLLLTGSASPAALRGRPYVAHGRIRDWIAALSAPEGARP